MRTIVILSIWLVVSSALSAQNYQLSSPDNKLTVNISIGKGITYSVEKEGYVIIQPSAIGIKTNRFDESIFNQAPTSDLKSVTQTIKPVWGITSELEDDYKLLTLSFGDKVSLQFRAYNHGVAWRFSTDFDGELLVYNENVEFQIPAESTIYFPATKGFLTPFEPSYAAENIGTIADKSLAITPLMFTSPKKHVVVISESNLFEYPGMFIEKKGLNALIGIYPQYPKRESQEFLGKLHLVKWPQLSRMVVRSTEKYIAKSNGKRDFPWRVIMVANSAVEILSNQLVYQLANEPQMDFSWVKPGKVVWDWYYNWNIPDVDFKPGINTQTYKHNIDFATRHGIEYVNIDDGWSKLWNFNRRNPDLNLDEVIAYAKSKNVGIFLWAMWNTIDKDFLANLDRFQQLGIVGLKVDFFDRTDQRMVDFVNKLAHECAKRKLMLNLHGMYKPTGINRTFPNVVNIEGVLGLEYNKFSDRCTPTHNLTIPFVRNVVGPMDYTPGAMRYMSPSSFQKSWDNPHAMTTKCQQLAMYIVYHGGIQMLADSPTFFEKDEVAMSFLSDVPVSWDESIPLTGNIGEVIAIARRKGESWYIGGMAGSQNQQVSFNLNFLDERDYTMTLLTDGVTNADVVKSEKNVSVNDVISLKIKEEGGFVIILK